MATETVSTLQTPPAGGTANLATRDASGLTLSDRLVGVGLEATYELDALCELLVKIADRDVDKQGGLAYQLRGIGLRARGLALNLMSLIHGDIASDDEASRVEFEVTGREPAILARAL